MTEKTGTITATITAPAVRICELQSRDLRRLFSPFLPELTAVDARARLLGSSSDEDGDGEQIFELIIGGEIRRGSHSWSVSSGCDTWNFLCLAETLTSDDLTEFSRCVSYAGGSDESDDLEDVHINGAHRLLPALGVIGMARTDDDSVTLTDGRILPVNRQNQLIENTPAAEPIIRRWRANWRNSWQMTREDLNTLARQPGWTKLTLGTPAGNGGTKSHAYRLGDQVVIGGTLTTRQNLRALFS